MSGCQPSGMYRKVDLLMLPWQVLSWELRHRERTGYLNSAVPQYFFLLS